jgi:hypothetical protein
MIQARKRDRNGVAEAEVRIMFQLALAEIIQADREREIAELVRQRRLLEPEYEARDPEITGDRTAEAHGPNARVQAAGS